jgi:hypothetical protein
MVAKGRKTKPEEKNRILQRDSNNTKNLGSCLWVINSSFSNYTLTNIGFK